MSSKHYKKECIFVLFAKGFKFLIFTPLYLKSYLDYTQLYLLWSSWHNWFYAVFIWSVYIIIIIYLYIYNYIYLNIYIYIYIYIYMHVFIQICLYIHFQGSQEFNSIFWTLGTLEKKLLSVVWSRVQSIFVIWIVN